MPKPTLYLIYNSDLSTDNELIISTFGDDTATFSYNDDPIIASNRFRNYLHKMANNSK